ATQQPGIGAVRVATRTSAVRDAIALADAPGWANGQQPARTLGPFLDSNARAHWFDVFQPVAHLTVSRGDQPFLLLPAGTARLRLALRLTIPAGTVWIRADQLAANAPPGSWAGLRVKGGTLTFQRGGVLTNGLLTVPGAASVTLQLELDPPAGAVAEPEAQVPATVSFVFGPLGVERIDAGQASLNAYGTPITLTRNANGAMYEATLRMVLVPMACSVDTLAIAAGEVTLVSAAD